MPSHKKLCIDIYRAEINVFFSAKQCEKFILDRFGVILQETTYAGEAMAGSLEFDGQGEFIYMVIPDCPWAISNLAHEAVHVAHFIMDSRGIPISMENTESEAYLVGYIVDKLIPDVLKESEKRTAKERKKREKEDENNRKQEIRESSKEVPESD